MSPHGLRARGAVLGAVRAWFAANAYVEVPSPALVPSGAMEEHLFPLAVDGRYLRTSPEFALKRVAAAGLPRIYEIGPCFRGRERGRWHSEEFLMLEWYRAGAGLTQLMDEVEQLVAVAWRAVGRTDVPRFQRHTVRELMRAQAGLDPATATAEQLAPGVDDWDEAFTRRWLADVEPALTGAHFVSDWPASQAALAQVRTDRGWPVAQRFELYVHGLELANAFLELTDPREQRRRFERSNAARVRAGEAPHPVDEALIAAVGRMPPTSGIALGLERLVAVAAGLPEIRCAQV